MEGSPSKKSQDVYVEHPAVLRLKFPSLGQDVKTTEFTSPSKWLEFLLFGIMCTLNHDSMPGESLVLSAVCSINKTMLQ